MKLVKIYKPEVRAFVRVCRRLARNMYVTGHGGNLAWKLDDDLLLITPTQMNKGDVRPRDVVFVNLAGDVVEGKRRPTGEIPMYLKFFAERPDIVSVLHCHPPHVCAVAITTAKNWLMRPLYPETTTEVGPVPIVPYAEPLTEELAQNFAPFLPKYNSFIMENHGLVTMSRGDIRWTLMNVELLEVTTQSMLQALQAGGIKELDREAVVRLGNVMRTRNLPLFGAPGVHQSLESIYFDADGDPIWA
jgi:L-fuculose-phosphate aldolase